MRKQLIIYGSILLVFIIYYSLKWIINHNFDSSNLNYYTHFLDSLFHGRINLISPPNTYDLSLYDNKWYLNWGPGAILFILPFYLINGINTSDVLFTLLAGMINVAIFYLALKEIQKAFHLKISLFKEIFILLTFAFASANFYLSLSGSIWFSEHVISIFYLLIFYVFYFLYLQKDKLSYLVYATLFFNLAWTTRYTLVFSGLLFLYPLYLYLKKHKKLPIKAVSIVTSITIIFISLILTYNYAKFNNPLDTGLKYHNGSPRFAEIIKNHEFFSLNNIPINAGYYFFNLPTPSQTFPFLEFDLEGNSIFIMYPAILLLLLFLKKTAIQKQNHKSFLLISTSTVITTLLLLLCYFTTGWSQLGSRYLLDVLPLLYLLLVFVIEKISTKLLFTILIYEIILNITGVIWFYKIEPFWL